MLVQTSRAPHYARGVSPRVHAAVNAERLAREHILKFWPEPIVEGRATVQGHPIDADEEIDPHDAMDLADMYEPEALGGRVAAQKGELHADSEGESDSPCARCMNSSCHAGLEDEAHCVSGLGNAEFFD